MQGGTLIAENDGGTVTDYVYVDGRPIATIQPSASPAANQVSYILADHLGTPQSVTNSSGDITWKTTYRAFGTTSAISSSTTQNLRLPGQYADGETGFNYNLNRDYMPNLGRYVQSDPIGIAGDLNTYAYAGLNPMVNKDPLGLDDAVSENDEYHSFFSLTNSGVGALLAFKYPFPKGSSIRGPFRFLNLDFSVGAIYTDLNPACDSSRPPVGRALDAVANGLNIAGAVPTPVSKVFAAASLPFAAEAWIDEHPDEVLDNRAVRWLFSKYGLDY